ncbi:MAG TPA: EamA family transporter [Nitrososphaeraceae archaeon]
MLLIQKSWVVFVYATTISVESIIIEFLVTLLHIPPILIAALSITLGGILLLLVKKLVIDRIGDKRSIKKKELPLFSILNKNLLYASLSLSIGVFTWYDSIARVGASKEVLLAGPLEVTLIVILARIFLKERLSKIHVTGIVVAVTGFLIAIISDTGTISPAMMTNSTPIVTFGDIEAIISALGFALGVLFLTKLLLKHSALEVAGASLLISGIILIGILLLIYFIYEVSFIYVASNENTLNVFAILMLFSILPFIGALSYTVGISRIGPGLTGTIGASGILITLFCQIALNELGIMSGNLPINIPLAVLGSVCGFLGVAIIHVRDGIQISA